MEIIRKDGVLGALTEDSMDHIATTAATKRFKKMDEKAQVHIALNLVEEPATLVTSLLM